MILLRFTVKVLKSVFGIYNKQILKWYSSNRIYKKKDKQYNVFAINRNVLTGILIFLI